MQQHSDDARRYGFTGTVAVHLCFGYTALVHGKPSGYSMAARKLRLRRPGAAGLRNHPGSSVMFAAIRPFRPLCDDARSLADRRRAFLAKSWNVQ